MTDVRQHFGSRVRTFRKARNLTQDQLAKQVNLSRTSVVNIEAGKQEVILKTVYAFAEAFRVTPGELLTETRPHIDRSSGAPECRCGLPMSENPHPDAGKPFTLLETGPVWACIPCGSKTLHAWCERAQRAEGALHKIQDGVRSVIGP